MGACVCVHVFRLLLCSRFFLFAVPSSSPAPPPRVSCPSSQKAFLRARVCVCASASVSVRQRVFAPSGPCRSYTHFHTNSTLTKGAILVLPLHPSFYVFLLLAFCVLPPPLPPSHTSGDVREVSAVSTALVGLSRLCACISRISPATA
ncbi:protein kinase, putative [Leishmania donovani]|uniref:Protein kinase, putative n=1 Tax=Leishmania donovani TaxID=5661 RepID=E9BFQ6_LEIDO|nr:protein kinase, putative [Leishmania donovani]CBZ34082.1 protein kinase, putative [Leishmania donovani]